MRKRASEERRSVTCETCDTECTNAMFVGLAVAWEGQQHPKSLTDAPFMGIKKSSNNVDIVPAAWLSFVLPRPNSGLCSSCLVYNTAAQRSMRSNQSNLSALVDWIRDFAVVKYKTSGCPLYRHSLVSPLSRGWHRRTINIFLHYHPLPSFKTPLCFHQLFLHVVQQHWFLVDPQCLFFTCDKYDNIHILCQSLRLTESKNETIPSRLPDSIWAVRSVRARHF